MGLLNRLGRWLSKPNTRRGYLTNRISWKYAGQWKVGEDKLGNQYYLYQPFSETPIRRLCIYKDGDTGLDSMPFLWYSWIRYQRESPPTEEELNEYDEYIKDIKDKAKDFESRDQALRREEAQFIQTQRDRLENERKQNQVEAQQEIMSMFAEREKALRIAAENKLAKVKEAERALKMQAEQLEQMKKAKLELDWETSKTTPTGSGETFRPGTWRPDAVETDNENIDQQETPSATKIPPKTKRQPYTPPKNP